MPFRENKWIGKSQITSCYFQFLSVSDNNGYHSNTALGNKEIDSK